MLTHIDQNNRPCMVDISDKTMTARSATARSLIQLPFELKQYLNDNDLVLKKGPVFQTAIIAATMAAKKTHEVIPFCHALPIDSCNIHIQLNDAFQAVIEVTIKCEYKTGVEMEALYAASVASLTIYDMCKALGHKDLQILSTQLIEKTGGKNDFKKN
jgi:cyclic pyranopterin phosphate synthase